MPFPSTPHCLSSISLPFSSLYPSPTTGPACSSLTAPVLHLPFHVACMHAHTHTREPAACSGLGGPRWLWSGSRGDVVGGEGLPTCLRSLAPEETWGPLPGISEQVASQLAKGKPWARGVPGGHPGQRLSRGVSARLPESSQPRGHLVLLMPGPALNHPGPSPLPCH